MISIGLDETLLYQFILLLVVIFLGKVLYINPVTATMKSRDEKINKLMGSAESNVQAVEDSKLAYEEKLKTIKAEIASYHIKSREEAAKEVEAIISQAKAEIAEVTEANRKELSASIENAKANLNNEVKAISEVIYSTISGRVA